MPVTDDDALDYRDEKIMEPPRLGTFLEDDVHRAPQAAKEFDDALDGLRAPN